MSIGWLSFAHQHYYEVQEARAEGKVGRLKEDL